jgi:glycosyltransferase involved in cell wall biosynthesis
MQPPKLTTEKQNETVAIFMGTYNGDQFLREQLDSIYAQTYTHWELWVSDDGSNDNTHHILKDYQARLGSDRFFITEGPKKGFSANFLSLTCNHQQKASYYAFSDQDDIWEPNKLQTAMDWFKTISQTEPALYCGRTTLIDATNTMIGHSPLFKKHPSFLNALIQNIGGGNTMVFNQQTIELLQKAGKNLTIVAHDWWVYLLVTGAGGIVYYDAHPALRYRQHGKNLIGSNVGILAKVYRIKMMCRGVLKDWNDLNFKALQSVKHLLTQKNQQILVDIMTARQMSFMPRVLKIKRTGIYRQTLLGNIALLVAAFLNKI